jgi:hypothetical protein
VGIWLVGRTEIIASGALPAANKHDRAHPFWVLLPAKSSRIMF